MVGIGEGSDPHGVCPVARRSSAIRSPLRNRVRSARSRSLPSSYRAVRTGSIKASDGGTSTTLTTTCHTIPRVTLYQSGSYSRAQGSRAVRSMSLGTTTRWLREGSGETFRVAPPTRTSVRFARVSMTVLSRLVRAKRRKFFRGVPLPSRTPVLRQRLLAQMHE